MNGYKGLSKSWNAIAAEKAGKYPASVVADFLKIPTELVRQHIKPCEWHHTSKMYNKTLYYSLEEARNFFSSSKGRDILREYEAPKEVAHESCLVEWLEWRARRPTVKREYGCRVVQKGSMVTIFFQNGQSIVKKMGSKGFSFRAAVEVPCGFKSEFQPSKKLWGFEDRAFQQFRREMVPQFLSFEFALAWLEKKGILLSAKALSVVKKHFKERSCRESTN